MAKSTDSKQTKIKERVGAFEVRLSDEKVEIEDVVYKQRKFVYKNNTIEYSTILSLLANNKIEDGVPAKKTSTEIENDKQAVHFIVAMLNSTQLLFLSNNVRSSFMDSVMALTENKSEDSDEINGLEETEEEILANMKAEVEAKEVLNDADFNNAEMHNGEDVDAVKLPTD